MKPAPMTRTCRRLGMMMMMIGGSEEGEVRWRCPVSVALSVKCLIQPLQHLQSEGRLTKHIFSHSCHPCQKPMVPVSRVVVVTAGNKRVYCEGRVGEDRQRERVKRSNVEIEREERL